MAFSEFTKPMGLEYIEDATGATVGVREVRQLSYRPNPSPAHFHRLCSDPKNVIVGFSGPIGSGKTTALVYEIINLAYQNAGLLGMIAAPTFSMLYISTMQELFRILNEEGIPFVHRQGHQGPHPSIYFPECDSFVFVRHLDAFERLRGPNLAWCAVDELSYAQKGSLTRLEARVRGVNVPNPKLIGAWTPNGFDWVYERFIRDAEVKEKWKVGRFEDVDVYGSACYTAANKHWVVRGCPFENKYTGEDYYERLKLSYDPQFFRQEVLGQYVSMGSGQVYYCFDRNVHVKPTTEYNPKLPIYWSWDFNVDPMCSVICQRPYDGPSRPVTAIDEIHVPHSSTPKVLEEFIRRYPEHKGPIYIYGDASAAYRGATTGSSDYAVIRDFFKNSPLVPADMREKVRFRVPEANPGVNFRVNAVNSLLRNASGDVGLYINQRCKELITDLEQVQYKEGTSDIDKYHDRSRTHMSDAFGYFVHHDYPVTTSKTGGSSKPLTF
jgi:hypothetical protein